MNIRRAIFLDRDGVIIRDIDLLTRPDQVELLDHAAQAISTLNQADYKVIVVSNQTVIARGLASEAQVNEVNEWLRVLLLEQAGAKIDAFYICPHHPNATLPAYRIDCDCRKPFPGLLFKAAKDFDLELEHSFMIGDRITDIIAGRKAGCKTILIQSGKHIDAPIETSMPIEGNIQPDAVFLDLSQAARFILAGEPD